MEEIFGWKKTVGLLRKLRHRGLELVGEIFTVTAAEYNLTLPLRNILLLSHPRPCQIVSEIS